MLSSVSDVAWMEPQSPGVRSGTAVISPHHSAWALSKAYEEFQACLNFLDLS